MTVLNYLFFIKFQFQNFNEELQKLKKSNFEENEPNYLEEEEEDDEKNDPFIDFLKEGGKLNKAPLEKMEKDKEIKEFTQKGTQANPNPIRKKSLGEEKKPPFKY